MDLWETTQGTSVQPLMHACVSRMLEHSRPVEGVGKVFDWCAAEIKGGNNIVIVAQSQGLDAFVCHTPCVEFALGDTACVLFRSFLGARHQRRFEGSSAPFELLAQFGPNVRGILLLSGMPMDAQVLCPIHVCL